MSNAAIFINTGATTVTVGDGLTGDGSGGDPLEVADPLTVGELDATTSTIATVTATTVNATTVQASYKSSDGTAGASAGPFTVITAIRVKNGLVTTLTGS